VVLYLLFSLPSSAFKLIHYPIARPIKQSTTSTQRCTPLPSSLPPSAWYLLLPPPRSMPVKSPRLLRSTATPAADAPEPFAYDRRTSKMSQTDQLQNIAGSGDLFPGCNVITDACQASLKLNYVNAGCKGNLHNFLKLY
jgi:hypothetical protein